MKVGPYFQRSLSLTVSVCLSGAALFGAACAQEPAHGQTPQPAPNFRLTRSTFTVQPHISQPQSNETQAGKKPLEGRVDGFGLGTLENGFAPPGTGTLKGNVDTLIKTPPVQGGATSQVVPPEVFRGWLDQAHHTFALSTDKMAQTDIVEIKGTWDDSSRTLRSLGIPYTRISGRALKDYNLETAKVLIVDCAGDVPGETLQKIRDFVSHGGYLLATDWALDHCVQKAFPGYVVWNGSKNRKSVYDATVADVDPVLFNHVVTNSHWKLDEESHCVRVLNQRAVRVLVRSTQLAKEDQDGQGILAAEFPFGRGYVLTLVGHFDNNAFFAFTNSLPDPAPSIGIALRQAIASNFVVAGLQGTRIK